MYVNVSHEKFPRLYYLLVLELFFTPHVHHSTHVVVISSSLLSAVFYVAVDMHST